MFVVCGEPMSLNKIKHSYLRGLFHDERIHFALSLPVKGFPQLRNEVYLGRDIGFVLDDDVLRFLKKHRGVHIDVVAKTITLSPILKWFGNDFIGRYALETTELKNFNIRERAVLNFLSRHIPEHTKFIQSGEYTLLYSDFDWTVRWEKIT